MCYIGYARESTSKFSTAATSYTGYEPEPPEPLMSLTLINYYRAKAGKPRIKENDLPVRIWLGRPLKINENTKLPGTLIDW